MDNILNLKISGKPKFGDEHLIKLQKQYQKAHAEKEKNDKLIAEGKLVKKKFEISFDISYWDTEIIEAYTREEVEDYIDDILPDILSDAHVETRIKEINV